MKIINKSRDTVIARHAKIADTVIARLQGLLGRDIFTPGEALLITRCRSIHTVFMRFSIDVIFVDKTDRVVGLARGIRPFRVSPYFFRAGYAIELPEGVVEKTGTALGDQVQVSQ